MTGNKKIGIFFALAAIVMCVIACIFIPGPAELNPGILGIIATTPLLSAKFSGYDKAERIRVGCVLGAFSIVCLVLIVFF